MTKEERALLVAMAETQGTQVKALIDFLKHGHTSKTSNAISKLEDKYGELYTALADVKNANKLANGG